jgi:hypothetical protein
MKLLPLASGGKLREDFDDATFSRVGYFSFGLAVRARR